MPLQFARKVQILGENGRQLFVTHQSRAATLLAQGVVVRIDNRRLIRCLKVPTHQLDDFAERQQNLRRPSDSSTRLHYRESFASGKQMVTIKRFDGLVPHRWPKDLSFDNLRSEHGEDPAERSARICMSPNAEQQMVHARA